MFTPTGLIEELEQIDHPSRDYMFYIFKSEVTASKTIKKALKNLLDVIHLKQEGHKYIYIPD